MIDFFFIFERFNQPSKSFGALLRHLPEGLAHLFNVQISQLIDLFGLAHLLGFLVYKVSQIKAPEQVQIQAVERSDLLLFLKVGTLSRVLNLCLLLFEGAERYRLGGQHRFQVQLRL